MKLGRKAPHDPVTHPRLKLGDFITSYPAAPPVVDYIGKVHSWPMSLNDELGDCTVAAAGHMITAWECYGQDSVWTLADKDALTAYEAVSGYVPGRPDTDQGAVMQDVLNYWRKTGIGGKKILAFAELNIHNSAELAAAMALFGHVYLGINFPAIFMDQFNAGEPWDVAPDDGGIEGGHAIDWGYVAAGRNHEVITWGAVQQMTPAAFGKYVEEAWIVIDQDWINTQGLNPEGLAVQALGEAFTQMTGEPSPFQPSPNPNPAPVPAPTPAPVDSDAVLAAAFRHDNWVAKHHTGDNAKVAKAAANWLLAKDL